MPIATVAPSDNTPAPYLPASFAPEGDRDRGDGDVEQGIGKGAQVQAGVVERQAIGGVVDRLVAGEELHHDCHVLLEQRAHLAGFEAEHRGVGRQGAGSDPEHDATARQMVEEHDSLGRPQRVVVRQRHHAGAELDAPGAGGCGSDEDLGGGDDLAAGGVVFTDPRLVEAEHVHVLQEVEIGLEGQCGVVLRWVERCHEGAETQVHDEVSVLL